MSKEKKYFTKKKYCHNSQLFARPKKCDYKVYLGRFDYLGDV